MLRVELTPLKKEGFGYLFEKTRIAWNNNGLNVISGIRRIQQTT
jgi:hypothetical protein